MDHRIIAIVLVTLLSNTACSNEPPKTSAENKAPAVASAEEPGATPTMKVISEWETAALELAKSLADKARVAGVTCDDYDVVRYGLYFKDYIDTLKIDPASVPIAETYCTSDDDEDLAFAVFANAVDAAGYIEKKRALLCRRAGQKDLFDFPGFPYVIGDRWIVQPDERTTSVKLAKILGGTEKMADCPELTAPQP